MYSPERRYLTPAQIVERFVRGVEEGESREVVKPKPSEVFPSGEKHRCFVCYGFFSPHDSSECPKCGWLICTVCGKCACHLSAEARGAIEALSETFCVNCRWRGGR